MQTERARLSDEARCARIAEPLLRWYAASARVLPWRSDPTPYHVLVSELMLQQTRVEAALPHYLAFIGELPDLASLAAVPEERLLKLWQGLGYYNRARSLQKTAQIAVSRYGGSLPADFGALCGLPGLGRYSAGAVASIAFGIRVPAADGNALRILSRLLERETDVGAAGAKKDAERLLTAALPQERPGDFNQALMDLGAGICLPGERAKCGSCPLREICLAGQDGTAARYPRRAPKKERRVETRTVFLLFSPDGLAVRKRAKKGLLGGLWELPGTEGRLDRAGAEAWLRGAGAEPLRMEETEPARHVFTHIVWEMTGWAAEIGRGGDFVFATRGELETEYCLPSAFSAMLAQADRYRREWFDGDPGISAR